MYFGGRSKDAYNLPNFLKTLFGPISIINHFASALASFRVIEMVGRSILVTGGSGFLGASLVRYLASSDAFSVKAPVRNSHISFPASVEILPIADLDASTSWQQALPGVEVVVHASGRVHVMNEAPQDPLVEQKPNEEYQCKAVGQSHSS